MIPRSLPQSKLRYWADLGPSEGSLRALLGPFVESGAPLALSILFGLLGATSEPGKLVGARKGEKAKGFCLGARLNVIIPQQ